jgi:hypothetical protein
LRGVVADSVAQERERGLAPFAQAAREAFALKRLALELFADVVDVRSVYADQRAGDDVGAGVAFWRPRFVGDQLR